MAHMVEAMAYNGEVPWHGLGDRVPEGISPQEMLQAAKLDWTVACEQLQTVTGHKVPGHYGLVRSSDNRVLDVVGSTWKPVQNHEAFDFFNEVCAAGKATMHTAGSLKGGKRVWALAKMKSGFKLPGRDQVEDYLLFSNPFEFGLPVEVFYTPVRVVCNNTIQLALTGKKITAFTHPHSRKWDADLVKQVLGVAREQVGRFQDAAQLMAKVKCSQDEFLNFANDVFPVKEGKESRKAEWLVGVFENQPGGAGNGTWWTAFNAATFLVDHQLGRSDDGRVTSAFFGYGAGVKRRALALATEAAKAAA